MGSEIYVSGINNIPLIEKLEDTGVKKQVNKSYIKPSTIALLFVV